MTNNQIQEYTLKISQATSTGLVVILYDLAVNYIDDAKKAYNSSGHAEFRRECTNARRVVLELINALDFNYELAMPLFRIYEFVSKEIADAVVKNDPKMLDKCKEYLLSLKGSFEKIEQSDKSGPAMGNAQTVYAGLTYGKGVLNENIENNNRGFSV